MGVKIIYFTKQRDELQTQSADAVIYEDVVVCANSLSKLNKYMSSIRDERRYELVNPENPGIMINGLVYLNTLSPCRFFDIPEVIRQSIKRNGGCGLVDAHVAKMDSQGPPCPELGVFGRLIKEKQRKSK